MAQGPRGGDPGFHPTAQSPRGGDPDVHPTAALARPMRVLVLMPYLYDTAPGQRYRIEQWARWLQPAGVEFSFVPFESSALKAILYANGRHVEKARELARCLVDRCRWLMNFDPDGWDAIFLYRELLPLGPPILERLLAKKGIPIIYDFDDALFLADTSEANRRFGWLKWARKTGTICRLSSHVVVGNDYLKQYALGRTASVSVIPPTIDTDTYTPKDDYRIDGVPVIGWSGSLTTQKHVRTIAGALQQLRKVVDFRLRIIGGNGMTIPGVEVETRKWTSQSERDEVKAFDVGIMPLPDDEWVRGKCGLKALLYMALGVPAVVSPVGVSTAIIDDGRNGFTAATEAEWVEKLSLLLRDENLRRRFGQEGRRSVERCYSARAQAPRLLEIMSRLAAAKLDERSRASR
jgi:glycosyltransferase involved in cell wall biosynthesis